MSGISGLIDNEILSGAYNTDKQNNAYCNIFTDDMLRKHWGVELPRRKEFTNRKLKSTANTVGRGGDPGGWDDNPISASVLDTYFSNLSRYEDSGVTQVDPVTASRLAADDKPVLVAGSGHATLAAPGDKWPLIFRSDLSGRDDDKRTRVGLKPTSSLRFFYIDPEKYRKFRDKLKENNVSGEDVFFGYDMDSKLSKKGK
jgi:hypothetical protein